MNDSQRWGRGAVGSAPRWHRGGRGFESHRLHQLSPLTSSPIHQFSVHFGPKMLRGREVILGYCTHQFLIAGLDKVTAIASGTWMNGRFQLISSILTTKTRSGSERSDINALRLCPNTNCRFSIWQACQLLVGRLTGQVPAQF